MVGSLSVAKALPPPLHIVLTAGPLRDATAPDRGTATMYVPLTMLTALEPGPA